MSWEHDGCSENIRKIRKDRRYRQRRRKIKQRVISAALAGVVCLGVAAVGKMKAAGETDTAEQTMDRQMQTQKGTGTETQQGDTRELRDISRDSQETYVERWKENGQDPEEIEESERLLVRSYLMSEEDLETFRDCPLELQELLEKYPETSDYVMGYSEREKYVGKTIDLTEEVTEGEVPLLLQWDKRWGYDNYGDKLIGVAGCGPTCMSMAYIYLTGNTEMNPREMAEFADRNGYNAEAGTKWDFFTDGAAILGLKGRELGLNEEEMKTALESGKVIICSMRPGDFTKTGHFILIRGYDGKGFLVNDPNSEINSEKRWDFETLRYQIKGQWSIGI